MTSYEELVIDREVDRSWRVFRDRLTDHLLDDPDVETYLWPRGADGSAAPAAVVIGCEDLALSVSIEIEVEGISRYGLDAADRRRLHDLGFRLVDGAPALVTARDLVDQAVHAVIVVLREIWGITLPSGVDDDGWEVVAPAAEARAHGVDGNGVFIGEVPEVVTLGDPGDLKVWVDRVLGQWFEHPPVYDPDGDIVVSGPHGSTAIVSQRGEGTGLEVWVVLARHVRRKKANEHLVRLSCTHRGARFFLDQDRLIASVVVEIRPFAPEHLLRAVSRICRIHHEEHALDLELRRRRADISDSDVDTRLGALFSSIWTRDVDADALAESLSGGDVATLSRWEMVAQRMAARFVPDDSMPAPERKARRAARAKWQRVERVTRRVREAVAAGRTS